jgi:hypothetical protein
MKKLISPKQHGYIDYGFIAAFATLPSALDLNTGAKKIYSGFAANLTLVNATTDHGAAIKPLISVKTHQKLDILNLGLLYGLSLTKPIRKDKRVLKFHLAATALATLNVVLTDYDK